MDNKYDTTSSTPNALRPGTSSTPTAATTVGTGSMGSPAATASTFSSAAGSTAPAAAAQRSNAEAGNGSRENARTADDVLAERAAMRADGQDMLSRVVKGAHDTIDRLADTAAPHVARLEDTLATANVRVHARADRARDVGDEWADSLRDTVRENPLAALAAAVALGVVVAKLSR